MSTAEENSRSISNDEQEPSDALTSLVLSDEEKEGMRRLGLDPVISVYDGIQSVWPHWDSFRSNWNHGYLPIDPPRHFCSTPTVVSTSPINSAFGEDSGVQSASALAPISPTYTQSMDGSALNLHQPTADSPSELSPQSPGSGVGPSTTYTEQVGPSTTHPEQTPDETSGGPSSSRGSSPPDSPDSSDSSGPSDASTTPTQLPRKPGLRRRFTPQTSSIRAPTGQSTAPSCSSFRYVATRPLGMGDQAHTVTSSRLGFGQTGDSPALAPVLRALELVGNDGAVTVAVASNAENPLGASLIFASRKRIKELLREEEEHDRRERERRTSTWGDDIGETWGSGNSAPSAESSSLEAAELQPVTVQDTSADSTEEDPTTIGDGRPSIVTDTYRRDPMARGRTPFACSKEANQDTSNRG